MMVENHTSFSRRGLLKGGGALIVGFILGETVLPVAAAHGDVAGPPDQNSVDTWIAVHADNTATVYLGKSELGQGNTTGLLQIVGEELDLAMSQLKSVRLDTNVTPKQDPTRASLSIQRGGPQVRAAAAEARQALLQRASIRLGVQPGSLTVTDGVVSVEGAPHRSLTYGELLGDKPFDVKFTGIAPQKPVNRYKLVGTRVPRVDIPDKANGKYVYMQHVRVPDMLHGRVVLPRGQRAFGTGAKVVSIDESSIKSVPAARVVRKGDFVGVVAEREWDAVKAAAALKVAWDDDEPSLPGNAELFDKMRSANSTERMVADWGDISKGFAEATYIRAATYHCPYQSHQPFAPNCAVADVGRNGALVMSSTQDIYDTRGQLATVLGLPVDRIRVQYYEGSGTFGRSCYEDAAQAAAIMSQAVGRPVRVQLMRWDEQGWDNYGPAHVAEVRAGADAEGKIVAYEYHGWQHGWTVTSSVQDISLQQPGEERAFGATSLGVNPSSTGSMYTVANRRTMNHLVPMVGYLRGGQLRSPLGLSLAFASEQTIDELAHAARMDPLEFRRKNIADKRWLGVLEAVAKAAEWRPRVANSVSTNADILTGRGVGLGTHNVSYAAAVAEVQVNKRTGEIVAKHLYGALDAGLVVNPALVENQIIGQLTQSTSRVLKEEVTFDQGGVTSLDWASYPILRFAEHPDVTAVVVQRLDEPSTGAGEEMTGAAAAAIANAVFDAVGVRLRQYPMTPLRVLAALATAPT